MSISIPRQSQTRRTQPRFARIVIIDDNTVDLFIAEAIINNVKLSKEVKRELSAGVVMKQLKNAERLSEVPELIFLDLKMDKTEMDGFSFLAEFNNLSDFIRNKCKIVVVTSSIDKEEKFRALMNPSVIRYFNKPLDVVQIQDFMYT
jgi:CheY-like chemotaxis protein